VYGLLVPALHNAALLEAVLPGFYWLTPASLLLGVVETFLWKDPHFERVWFPSGGPQVTRTPAGLMSLFDAPGEYRGRFTVAGGVHGTTGKVFPVTVVVRRPGGLTLASARPSTPH
jgi:hypothetical protein